MSTTAKRALWVVLLLACAGLVWLALSGTLAVGRAPISAAPPAPDATGAVSEAGRAPSSSPAMSSRPTATTATASDTPETPATPTPSEASEPVEAEGAEPTEADEPAEAEGAEPTEAESATPADPAEAAEPAWAGLMTGPAAPWEAIAAAPVHVEVHQDGERVVGAPVEHTQTDEDGELDPDPQTVGWYGAPQWSTTPGERSPYAGVLAGHVVYYGVKDVFWNLGDVRAGAVVVLTYDDGTQAAFEVDADAVSVEKEALTQDPANRWAWEPGGDDAKVTLITCDLVPGTGLAGNSFNNWVLQATRVA